MLSPRPQRQVFDPNGNVAIDLTPVVPKPVEFNAGQLLGASFQAENIIGSLAANLNSQSSEPDVQGYSPWDDIKGTDYETFFDRFTDTRSPGQVTARKAQIDRELEGRRIREAAGGWGILTDIGAAVFSPEILLPGGQVYRGARLGTNVARSALSVGLAAGASTAAIEAGLQASQVTRTPLESAFNIGGAAVLGGMLGAGMSAIFTRNDFARLGKGLSAEAAMATSPGTVALGRAAQDQMLTRLMGAGFSEAEAKPQAALYAGFYGTMSTRTGKSVEELLSAYPLPEVARGGEAAPDALFQFAGRRAQNWDDDAFGRAVGMEATGASRDDIWDLTGFFRGADNKWRFEVSDAAARLRDGNFVRDPNISGQRFSAGRLDAVIDHPKLFEAYPDLRDIRATVRVGDEMSGMWDGDAITATGRTPEAARSVLLHEIAHVIQAHEGFATGSNLNAGEMYTGPNVAKAQGMLTEAEGKLQRAYERGDMDAVKDAQDEVEYSRKQLTRMAAYEYYKRVGGEVEARNVQARGGWRTGERPWETQDVPESEVIVRGREIISANVEDAWQRSIEGSPSGELASATKAIVDRLDADALALRNLLEGGAIASHADGSFKVPASVVTHVARVIEDEEIAGAVVRAVPVDVVNLLSRKQGSPEDVLRDKAMLKDVLTVDRAAAVSLDIDVAGSVRSLVSVVADAATERASNLAGRPLKDGPALGAGKGNSVSGAHRRSVVDTPEFSRWFKDSKVVDADGKPLVVYHGTDAEIDAFDLAAINSSGRNVRLLGEGFYFTSDAAQAAGYGKNVIPVYLKIENPRTQGADGMLAPRAPDQDGTIARGTPGTKTGETVYVVKDPTQIKSAQNRGTFDPADPRILFQPQRDQEPVPNMDGAPRAAISWDREGKSLVRLFETADRSSFLHESAHFFLEGMRTLKGDLGGEWAAVSKAFGIEDGKPISVDAHERFARSFEAYLRDGKAPSPELASAFQMFKEWLTAIYRQLTELNVTMSDDVKVVFDRMLADDAELGTMRDPQRLNERAVIRAASGGAAAMPRASLDDNTVAGRAAERVGAAVSAIIPNLRALNSPSAVWRSISTRLIENPVYLKKNMAGVATEPAAETLVREYTDGAVPRALDETNRIFSEYRKAGGQLKRPEFNVEVSKAMRRGDDGPDIDPHVGRAAKAWRTRVFDPLKEAAIKAGLLPKDVHVSTALSYLTRMWSRPALEANEAEFKAITRDYIDQALRGLELKADEIRIGNRMVEAEDVVAKWQAAYASLDAIEERVAGRVGQRAGMLSRLQEAQAARFEAEAGLPPPEVIARLRGADGGAGVVDVLRELRAQERSVGRLQKQPVLTWLKTREGGVRIGSPLDAELRAMGVTPRTNPGLFRADGGRGALDNIVWDEADLWTDNFGRPADGYVPEADLMDAIRRELAGDPLRTAREAELELALDSLDRDASDWLEAVGLPANATVNDARAMIRRVAGAEQRAQKLTDRIVQMEQRLEEFDRKTDPLFNERAVRGAAAAVLNRQMERLDEELLELKQFADASPRVGIIIDFANARAKVAKDKAKMSALTRRTELLKVLRAEGGLSDDLAMELSANVADMNRLADAIRKGEARVAKLEPMVPRIKQEPTDFTSEADRRSYVDEVTNSIFDQLTGRVADGDIPRDVVAAVRGPLKDRTFGIQDLKVEKFLENDIEKVGRFYARSMAADIELKNAFGSADMKEQIAAVQQDYQRMRDLVEKDIDPETGVVAEKPLSAARKAALLNRLNEREKTDLVDLRAMRDMVRNAYAKQENSTNFARALRAAGTINYLRAMGGVTLSSLTDTARHMMVHGFDGVFRDGLIPLMSNLKAVKLSVQEAQYAGAVAEVLNNSRMATLAEINDPYGMRSPFERMLENAANGFSKLNGMVYWNEWQKSFASILTQNRLLRNVGMDWARLKPKEQAYMAYLGIDQGMAARIQRQFEKFGTTEQGNVRVAGTDDWEDEWARRVYRAAVSKDVGTTIVTKGIGDVPLFMNRPVGRAVMQFKGFAIASHQRVLMRGLQERQTGVLAGMMTATAIGMFIYWAKSWEANRAEDISDNPGRWIAEGLDRSGMFAIGFEVNNTIEKAFGIGAYGALQAAFPGSDQNGKASRYIARSTAAGFLGPTGDLVDTVVRAGNAIKGSADGWTEGDINSVKRLVPGATLPGFRSMVEWVGVPAVQEAIGK